MPHSNAASWPRTAAHPDASPATSRAFGPVFDAQAQLWSCVADANRGLWSLCTPWLHAAPWWWNVPAALIGREEAGKEPAQTVDGVPDTLELQARTWNHVLDAQRSFWSVLSPGKPALPSGPSNAADTAPRSADEGDDLAATKARRRPHSAPRKARPARTRAR